MRLAFSTLACPDWSVKQVVSAAQRYGYQGIEWRVVDGDFVDARFSLSAARAIGRMVRSAGLSVCAVDAGSDDICLLMPPGRDAQAVRKRAKKFIRIAEAMGAEFVRILPGDLPAGVDLEEGASWAADQLESLEGDIRDSGVKLTLELHYPKEEMLFAGKAITASTLVATILTKVQNPEIGVQWDWGNCWIEHESVEETWERVKTRLHYCHAKDLTWNEDGSARYVPMGDGVLPIEKILELLTEGEFDGWLSFEWEKRWHPELAGPDIALPQYTAYLSR